MGGLIMKITKRKKALLGFAASTILVLGACGDQGVPVYGVDSVYNNETPDVYGIPYDPDPVPEYGVEIDDTYYDPDPVPEYGVDYYDPYEDYQDYFYSTGITDEIFARMEGKSFKEDCTLPREDLSYLHVLHKNLEGETLEGEMVVNKYIAEDVLDIMMKLYEADYPIERIQLVDDYDADDELSMEANNSSSFNFRFISHTTKVSKHGLGLAVDINTLYNPYVKTVDGELSIEPVTAEPYTHREEDFPYKIEKDDLCYQLFIEHGFEWGGDWESAKDYQHFELPDDVVEQLYPGMR